MSEGRDHEEARLRGRIEQVSDPIEWLIEAHLLQHVRMEEVHRRLEAVRLREAWLENCLRKVLGLNYYEPLPSSDEMEKRAA